uniref:Uncharacterized protein n=1 Tax=Anguilla anguilla TaxID=7936 RepID=A0A0E9S7G8_ANGAN
MELPISLDTDFVRGAAPLAIEACFTLQVTLDWDFHFAVETSKKLVTEKMPLSRSTGSLVMPSL